MVYYITAVRLHNYENAKSVVIKSVRVSSNAFYQWPLATIS